MQIRVLKNSIIYNKNMKNFFKKVINDTIPIKSYVKYDENDMIPDELDIVIALKKMKLEKQQEHQE